MSNKLKLYVVGGSSGEALSHAGWLHADLVPTIEQADLVLFRGGDDVNPALYGEPRHPSTQTPNLARDKFEVAEFKVALHLKKPLIGICRGSQFLCVMAGGKLVQDQSGQGSVHRVHVWNKPSLADRQIAGSIEIVVSSTHHQAQYPWDLPSAEFRILGWTYGLSEYHDDGKGRELVLIDEPGISKREVEIAYYRRINALGIQSHPEYDFDTSDSYMRGLVDLLMTGKL